MQYPSCNVGTYACQNRWLTHKKIKNRRSKNRRRTQKRKKRRRRAKKSKPIVNYLVMIRYQTRETRWEAKNNVSTLLAKNCCGHPFFFVRNFWDKIEFEFLNIFYIEDTEVLCKHALTGLKNQNGKLLF